MRDDIDMDGHSITDVTQINTDIVQVLSGIKLQNYVISSVSNNNIQINPHGTGDVLIHGGSSGGNTGVTITDGGAITAYADITSNASDKRLKKDICIIENPLDKLKKLSGFTFNWNKEKCESAGFKPKYEQSRCIRKI